MRFKLQNFSVLLAAISLALCFSACAPTRPSPEAEATDIPREIKPLLIVTSTPDPKIPPSSSQTRRPAFNPQNPDWKLRYHELYEDFASKFTPPSLGQNVQVELENGISQNGILKNLTDSELSLGLENGEVALTIDDLSSRSAAEFFAAAYAREQALEQGGREYNRWQRMQSAANPEPTPMPTSEPIRELAEDDQNNPANTPGQNGVDAPDSPSSVSNSPKNEGPTGRVTQVEEYIRKNAALPGSLKVKAWGPVQENGNGYKVRVQYSLESAGGFGTSHEDMMFFMYSSGRVYRKAAVK